MKKLDVVVSEKQLITLIIPAFNEALSLPSLIERLHSVLKTEQLEVIIVDDGSTDNTIEVVVELSKQYAFLRYISFSRNFGHMQALRAGIDHAKGDCAITLDADLQHPPELVPELIKKWREGFDIVNTVRTGTKDTSSTKKLTSAIYYWCINYLADTPISSGAADFRLMDRVVVKILQQYREQEIFWRGLIPSLGFKVTQISYEADARHSGKTKYNSRKMLRLARHGILAVSTRPLRLAIVLAFITGSLSLLYMCYALGVRIFTDKALTGWTSLIVIISAIGSLQFFVLGIMGEYLAQVLKEVRHRPNYIISKTNLPELKLEAM